MPDTCNPIYMVYKPGYTVYKPGHIDIICLAILWIIFFVALFLAQGIWLIIDIFLLIGTAAITGKTVGEMVTA